MWRILTACLLLASLALGHHDGTDHGEDDDRKALIMIEIERNVGNGTGLKDKRSPQHESSQAVYGASPGQFVVRTVPTEESGSQADIPPEYLSLLQQLVVQQHQGAGQDAQQQLPPINELLVARNPDPSAVQFTASPTQPPRPRRPPPSPQAQLQKLYFDRQFQQQIPVRPRLLRPPPQPQPQSQPESQFSTVPATSQVYNIHEARLRASLAGEDPNAAVQTFSQQIFPTTASSGLDQQLTHISSSQEQLTELQSAPQQAVSQQIIRTSPQVQYVQQPVQRSASYSSSNRQSTPPQFISAERSKHQRRPSPSSAPEQYLRETTQPQAEQIIQQIPRQHLTSDPKIYLASESGQQGPQSSQDDEFIQQLLSGNGRGLFPSSTPSPSAAAEEIIKSTTSLPSSPSRSSIYVTQNTNVKSSPTSSKLTIEEVGIPQEDARTALPVVHLPTPEGQRPLTQSELQALIDAGFNIQPISEESQTTQSITPQYYQQPTTKRQRSYVTSAPPRNDISHQSRPQKQEEATEEVRYVQQVGSREEELQQRPQQQLNSRYRLQGSKPQQAQDEIAQYVQRPAPQEHKIPPGQSRFRIVVGNSEPQEQSIQFVQLSTIPDEIRQKEQFTTTFQPEDDSLNQRTQLLRIQEEGENIAQIQTTRYQAETSEPEQTYQTESVRLPQQITTYQREKSVTPQRPRFHPIVVPELPSTTPVPSSSVPRRRRPRPPTHSRIVFRSQAQDDDPSNVPEQTQQQFLISYDNIPEASSFGTKSRVRSRRPVQDQES